MTGELLRTTFEIGYFAMVVVSIVLVLVRKREPEASLGWILAIVFIPIVGMTLFFLIGFRKIPGRLRRKVSHHITFADRLANTQMLESHEDISASELGRQGITRIAQQLGGSPVRSGNEVELLESGARAFRKIFEAINHAEKHVHVQTFIFRHDGLGEQFIDLLTRKVRDGVEVRLLVDAFGSVGAWRLLRRLREAGGHCAVFLPLFPLGNRFAPNLRNHRKIVVCDGKVGFFGGLNIGEEYLGRRKRFPHWCDAHMKIVGPSVWDLQRIFVEDWDFATSELLTGERYFPEIVGTGTAKAQMVAAGPDQEKEMNAIHHIYFSAIAMAQHRLWIATPYFVPDSAIRTALVTAAMRGVEVIMLTQGHPPDHWLPYWAAAYFGEEMLVSGIRVFQYQKGMMHAKVMIVDDQWCSVGSANMDNRSLTLNFEQIGMFEDPDPIRAVEAWFRFELKNSREMELSTFMNRPWTNRLLEVGAHLLAPLL